MSSYCPGHDYGDPGYPPEECAACKALNEPSATFRIATLEAQVSELQKRVTVRGTTSDISIEEYVEGLRVEIDELHGKLAEAERERDFAHTREQVYRQQRDSAWSERDALAGALRKYGSHDPDCSAHITNWPSLKQSGKCGCGIDHALTCGGTTADAC